MRTSLLIPVLALAAGGLVLLVLAQDPEPAPTDARGVRDEWTGPAEGGAGDGLLRFEAAPIEVVPAGRWPKGLDEDEDSLVTNNSHLLHVRRRADPDEGDPAPTGEQALDFLTRGFAGRAAIRFRDSAALEAFRAQKYPEKRLPAGFSLHQLLDTLPEIGFRAVLRPDAVYLFRIKEP